MRLNYLIHKSTWMNFLLINLLKILFLVVNILNIDLIYCKPINVNKLYNLRPTIFLVRNDYILEYNNIHNKSNSYYSINQTYNHVIKRLTYKKIEKQNISEFTRAKILVFQEINKRINNLILQNPYVIKYKADDSVVINVAYYSQEDKNAFDCNYVCCLENSITNFLDEDIFYDFNLIRISLGLPVKWYYNEKTFFQFNSYLNIVSLFGIYILLKENKEFFLPRQIIQENTLNTRKLESIFGIAKRRFLKFLLQELKNLGFSKNITNNLVKRIKAEMN